MPILARLVAAGAMLAAAVGAHQALRDLAHVLVVAHRKGEVHRCDSAGIDDRRAAQLWRQPVRWFLDVSSPSCHGGSHLGFALRAEERVVRNHGPPAEGHEL